MELHQNIEGVLFYKATPVKKSALCKLFGVDADQLTVALDELMTRLQNGAVRLAHTETEVQLVTAPELDELLEGVRKDELKRDIGKAGAETLAIVLYRGPITRAEIDRIRGVNSSFILRNLLVRGLVERDQDKMGSHFSITPMLLSHLGITNKMELPNYAQVLDSLEKFEKDQQEQETISHE
jgi:segregation and condensation protein B